MPFDAAVAATYVRKHSQAGSTGKCATYVVHALESGGLTIVHTLSAKNLGPSLTAAGMKEVADSAYTPKAGDVVVIQPYTGGSMHGHVAMYDGTAWVSDFVQNDMWGGPGYRKNQPSKKVYRVGL